MGIENKGNGCTAAAPVAKDLAPQWEHHLRQVLQAAYRRVRDVRPFNLVEQDHSHHPLLAFFANNHNVNSTRCISTTCSRKLGGVLLGHRVRILSTEFARVAVAAGMGGGQGHAGRGIAVLAAGRRMAGRGRKRRADGGGVRPFGLAIGRVGGPRRCDPVVRPSQCGGGKVPRLGRLRGLSITL